MELDYKAIGKRIKIARIKADLTQERLAELIDISPTHLSNIETGTTRVSLNTIISIANALSVTGDDLLCDNIIMSKVQFEKDIALLLEDCDEYEIRIIKDNDRFFEGYPAPGRKPPHSRQKNILNQQRHHKTSLYSQRLFLWEPAM